MHDLMRNRLAIYSQTGKQVDQSKLFRKRHQYVNEKF